MTAIVSWGGLALDYLEKRKTAGMANPCSLPEMFTALREKQPELTLTAFHTGLRKLHDRGVLRLLAMRAPMACQSRSTRCSTERPRFTTCHGRSLNSIARSAFSKYPRVPFFFSTNPSFSSLLKT